MRGSKVLVIWPPPLGMPPTIALVGAVAPVPRVVPAGTVPWVPLMVPGR